MDLSSDVSNVPMNKLVGLNQYLLAGRVKGIVEFVFGGNRVKVFIPEKKVYIAVRLAGIRVGNYMASRDQDEVSKKAKEYMNETICSGKWRSASRPPDRNSG